MQFIHLCLSRDWRPFPKIPSIDMYTNPIDNRGVRRDTSIRTFVFDNTNRSRASGLQVRNRITHAAKSFHTMDANVAVETDLDDENDTNRIGLLQRRHSKPVESFRTFLQPEAQPKSSSAIHGSNPWTGQTADEVREAAFSQWQYDQMTKEGRSNAK
jgi:hypothetical protein